MDPVLKAVNVKKYFPLSRGFFGKSKWCVKAVDGVSVEVRPREVLALVGESGSGKTTLGKVLIGLMKPSEGRILYKGRDIASVDRRARKGLQMIFQNPDSSLNPRMLVADIIAEALKARWPDAETDALLEEVVKLLEVVGLSPTHACKYPHELSGGEKQRVAIARAIAVEPEVIVADEPVSALDVSIKAQILNLLLDVQSMSGAAMVFITHDLGVVWQMSDRVAVMYLGKVVEEAPTEELFEKPAHPYTNMLLEAALLTRPSLARYKPPLASTSIKGDVPSPINLPPGCRYHPRCPFAGGACKEREPELVEISSNHKVACLRAKIL